MSKIRSAFGLLTLADQIELKITLDGKQKERFWPNSTVMVNLERENIKSTFVASFAEPLMEEGPKCTHCPKIMV